MSGWPPLLLLLLVLVGAATRSTACTAKHTVLVGIDGLSSEPLQKASTPNIDKLIKDGQANTKLRALIPQGSKSTWLNVLHGSRPENSGFLSTTNFGIDGQPLPPSPGYLAESIFEIARYIRPHLKSYVYSDCAGLVKQLEKDVDYVMRTDSESIIDDTESDLEKAQDEAIAKLKSYKQILVQKMANETDVVQMKKLLHEWTNLNLDTVGYTESRTKIQEGVLPYWKDSDQRVAEMFMNNFNTSTSRNQSTLSFVNFRQCDYYGLTYGWNSTEYHRSIARVDALIGRLIRHLEETSDWNSTSISILGETGGSDHQHSPFSASDCDTEEGHRDPYCRASRLNYQMDVPWIVSGACLITNVLYVDEGSFPRVRPDHFLGNGQASFSSLPRLTTVDVVPTLLFWALGNRERAFPQCLDGKAIKDVLIYHGT